MEKQAPDLLELYEGIRRLHRIDYIDCLNRNAPTRLSELSSRRYFYRLQMQMLRFVIPAGKRVLCLCADAGEFLDMLEPSVGVGVEASAAMIEVAKKQYPQYTFIEAQAEDYVPDEVFDFILLPYAVNCIFDVQKVLANLQKGCDKDTRLVMIYYNFLWKPLIQLGEFLGMKRRFPNQNWFSVRHMELLLRLEEYELTRTKYGILFPYRIPLVSDLINRLLASLPFVQNLCLINMLVVRSAKAAQLRGTPLPGVSVVIPCKNEAENVEAAVLRIPSMGSRTEVIFCDDKSTDGTVAEVLRMQQLYPEKNIRLVEGPGISKSRNVWTGFDAAREDVLMILDADLTVAPEELPRFYDALVSGKGEFINGTRMIYPMRNRAMRIANLLGNKFFSLTFSYILGDYISDTLCGTKVLWRTDWQKIRPFLDTWGINDRWGDYELIFGAARLGKKHQDLPVHYAERVHGETKMTGRLKNGWIMLKMCWAAFRKFK